MCLHLLYNVFTFTLQCVYICLWSSFDNKPIYAVTVVVGNEITSWWHRRLFKNTTQYNYRCISVNSTMSRPKRRRTHRLPVTPLYRPLLTHMNELALGYLDWYSAEARGSGWACVAG